MKHIKRILFVLIAGILAMAIMFYYGTKKPKKVLENTFSEIKENANDSNIKFFELGIQSEGVGENSDFLDDECKQLINDAFSKLQFKINGEQVKGDTATCNVSVVGPNISLALSNTAVNKTMGINGATASDTNTEENNVPNDNANANVDVNDILRNALKESFEHIKTDDRTGTITLSKVDDKWTVNENNEFVQLILGKSK